MAVRDNPYGAFAFQVRLGNEGGEDQIAGGFSDASGLGNEVKFSEYRNGNDLENHVRKIPNTNGTDPSTCSPAGTTTGRSGSESGCASASSTPSRRPAAS